MNRILASFVIAATLFAAKSFAAGSTVNVNTLAYASTNVTTSSYVQLVAASPMSVAKLQICDTSTKLLKLAIGAASSEVDICTVNISGCVIVPYYIPAGTRISIKAVDANATSGYNSLSFIP